MADGRIVRKDEIVLVRVPGQSIPHKPEQEIALLPDCAGWQPSTTVAMRPAIKDGLVAETKRNTWRNG